MVTAFPGNEDVLKSIARMNMLKAAECFSFFVAET